jgi:BirA family transcriptional regulator, biotin operon repressor / biotin---[acetyl-CoA-carboxylase] ligase
MAYWRTLGPLANVTVSNMDRNEETNVSTEDMRLSETLDRVAEEYREFATKVGASVPVLPRTRQVADRVIALAGIDSTNILARRLLSSGRLRVVDEAGTPQMVAMCADAQASGHGRLGRKWADKTGGASFLVTFITALPKRVVTNPQYNGWFTITAGLATLDALNGALSECVAKPIAGGDGSDASRVLALKWPNDIFCGGRKLGGILAELVELPEGANMMVVPKPEVCDEDGSRRARKDGMPDDSEVRNATEGHGAASATTGAQPASPEPAVGVMFGIGMNLDLPAEMLPTPISTSLQLLYAPLPDAAHMRDMVASRLVASLRKRLATFAAVPQIELPRLLGETRVNCWTLGRRVEAKFTDGSRLIGKAVALNPDASLTVEDEVTGAGHVVKTADVGVLA